MLRQQQQQIIIIIIIRIFDILNIICMKTIMFKRGRHGTDRKIVEDKIGGNNKQQQKHQ